MNSATFTAIPGILPSFAFSNLPSPQAQPGQVSALVADAFNNPLYYVPPNVLAMGVPISNAQIVQSHSLPVTNGQQDQVAAFATNAFNNWPCYVPPNAFAVGVPISNAQIVQSHSLPVSNGQQDQVAAFALNAFNNSPYYVPPNVFAVGVPISNAQITPPQIADGKLTIDNPPAYLSANRISMQRACRKERREEAANPSPTMASNSNGPSRDEPVVPQTAPQSVMPHRQQQLRFFKPEVDENREKLIKDRFNSIQNAIQNSPSHSKDGNRLSVYWNKGPSPQPQIVQINKNRLSKFPHFLVLDDKGIEHKVCASKLYLTDQTPLPPLKSEPGKLVFPIRTAVLVRERNAPTKLTQYVLTKGVFSTTKKAYGYVATDPEKKGAQFQSNRIIMQS